ncbi:hypothetical protein GCM10009579_18710 [Streptomyces javensis]|uniref:Uncharacterized protein n=1 Tax=Streptomyces javensis TaxID=114698 RepID=A0ABP4HIG9_9ACTN
MVIISPAIPSETVKPDPIEVSRPIGRISVVTMAKIPSITETTAGHPFSGARGVESRPLAEAVVVIGMAAFRPVKGSAFAISPAGSIKRWLAGLRPHPRPSGVMSHTRHQRGRRPSMSKAQMDRKAASDPRACHSGAWAGWW